jgi:hypothetical protein
LHHPLLGRTFAAAARFSTLLAPLALTGLAVAFPGIANAESAVAEGLTQFIDCQPFGWAASMADGEKVILSLQASAPLQASPAASFRSGTLFISWNLETDTNSGVLRLERSPHHSTASEAAFQVAGPTYRPSEPLRALVPTAVLGKNADSFQLSLEGILASPSLGEIRYSRERRYLCFSRIFQDAL